MTMNNNSSSESVIDRCADNSLSISKYEEYVCVVIGFSALAVWLAKPSCRRELRYDLELADIVGREHQAFATHRRRYAYRTHRKAYQAGPKLRPDLEPFDSQQARASAPRSLGAIQ